MSSKLAAQVLQDVICSQGFGKTQGPHVGPGLAPCCTASLAVANAVSHT
jgi:hypothetical protein